MSVGVVRVILADSARSKLLVTIVRRMSRCMRSHDTVKTENGGKVTFRFCDEMRYAIVKRQRVLLRITRFICGRTFSSVFSSNTIAAYFSVTNGLLFPERQNFTVRSDEFAQPSR